MIPLEHVIAVSAALFAIGTIGVLVRRNVIVVLLSIELMLNGVNLAFVGFNRVWAVGEDGGVALDGQVFVMLVVAIAAAQLAVGLAIVLAAFRNRASLDLEEASLMRW